MQWVKPFTLIISVGLLIGVLLANLLVHFHADVSWKTMHDGPYVYVSVIRVEEQYEIPGPLPQPGAELPRYSLFHLLCYLVFQISKSVQNLSLK